MHSVESFLRTLLETRGPVTFQDGVATFEHGIQVDVQDLLKSQPSLAEFWAEEINNNLLLASQKELEVFAGLNVEPVEDRVNLVAGAARVTLATGRVVVAQSAWVSENHPIIVRFFTPFEAEAMMAVQAAAILAVEHNGS